MTYFLHPNMIYIFSSITRIHGKMIFIVFIGFDRVIHADDLVLFFKADFLRTELHFGLIGLLLSHSIKKSTEPFFLPGQLNRSFKIVVVADILTRLSGSRSTGGTTTRGW